MVTNKVAIYLNILINTMYPSLIIKKKKVFSDILLFNYQRLYQLCLLEPTIYIYIYIYIFIYLFIHVWCGAVLLSK